MGANNYRECPTCKQKKKESVQEARRIVKELYGKVPADEYKAAVELSESDYSVDLTLAEYYEIGIQGVNFTVSYGAACRTCGFSFDYNHEQELEPDQPKGGDSN